MRRRRSSGMPVAAMGWSPFVLGASLLAWWDAERSDLITQSGGLVSSWRDIVAGYDATQSVGASKPAYSGTGFNNRPGLIFDGVDDELTCVAGGLLAQLGGSASYELWLAVSQDALVADATTRFLLNVGDGSVNTSRSVNRLVSGGVNRARTLVGNGASSVGASQTTTDFSGRHIVRGASTATDVTTTVDGVASSTAAVVPNTTATRLRLGAGSAASAASFHNGVVSAALITGPLSAGDAAKLYAYLSPRI